MVKVNAPKNGAKKFSILLYVSVILFFTTEVASAAHLYIQIVDYSDNQPLSAVDVYWDDNYKGITDSNGIIILELPSEEEKCGIFDGYGMYCHRLKIIKSGYVEQSGEVTVIDSDLNNPDNGLKVHMKKSQESAITPSYGDNPQQTNTYSSEPVTYSLTVKVRKQVSGGYTEPLEDARVFLDNNEQGYTDQYGKITINGVSKDSHTIKVEKSDYEEKSKDVYVDSADTIDFLLKPITYSLTINMIDEFSGEPVPSASFHFSIDDTPYFRGTDSGGKIVITDVTKGLHKIKVDEEVAADGYKETTQTATVPDTKEVTIPLTLKQTKKYKDRSNSDYYDSLVQVNGNTANVELSNLNDVFYKKDDKGNLVAYTIPIKLQNVKKGSTIKIKYTIKAEDSSNFILGIANVNMKWDTHAIWASDPRIKLDWDKIYNGERYGIGSRYNGIDMESYSGVGYNDITKLLRGNYELTLNIESLGKSWCVPIFGCIGDEPKNVDLDLSISMAGTGEKGMKDIAWLGEKFEELRYISLFGGG